MVEGQIAKTRRSSFNLILIMKKNVATTEDLGPRKESTEGKGLDFVALDGDGGLLCIEGRWLTSRLAQSGGTLPPQRGWRGR